MITGLNPHSALSQGDRELQPKEVAAKVQAMFMEVMIKAMEDSVGAEDGFFGGSASSEIYRGMLREQLASALSGQVKGPLEEHLGEHLEEHLDLPVDGVISSQQGWRKDPINGESRYHAGTDIAAPEGTPVKAVEGGRVIESGRKGGYGNAVVVQTEDGRKMLYAHNNQNYVRVGDWVSRGDAIAEVGSTGRATGPHVHFEVKF